jgi:ABC-2 type transport system permease protein
VLQIFFLGSLFFTVAALTRKLFVMYLQGVVVFLAYLIVNIVFSATGSLEHFWSAICDPVGLRLVDSVTRYWTVIEKNTLQLPRSGIFLYNRLIWSSFGLLCLIAAYLLFPFSVEPLTAGSRARKAARDAEIEQTGGKRFGSPSPLFWQWSRLHWRREVRTTPGPGAFGLRTVARGASPPWPPAFC